MRVLKFSDPGALFSRFIFEVNIKMTLKFLLIGNRVTVLLNYVGVSLMFLFALVNFLY